jgi:hypothetical protein
MKVKPTCFIAMAFGREDTDLLYENLILPVLKSLNINPIIINRQEKNDDLNFQIIEELKACDFAIADLTYARPSVYFEAGFAQRAVEVIYTVRSDHLDNKNPDELRVHFDLQMKPLIIWSDIDDQKFSRKLSRRITKTFLQKWNLQKKEDEQKEVEEKTLNSLPQNSIEILLRKTAIEKLSKKNYKKWIVKQSPNHPNYIYPEDMILQGRKNNIYSLKISQSEIKLVSINSFASATKGTLVDIIKHYDYFNIRLTIDGFLKNGVSVTVNHLIFSLRTIPDSRIKDVLPSFYKAPEYSIYSQSSGIKPLRDRSKKEIPIETNFLFISNITRISKFEDDLTKYINIKQL